MSAEILRVSLGIRPESQRIVGVSTREAIFLRVADGARVGFGECAPLPGLHTESVDDCMEAIEEWSDGLRELHELPPSAAFAASCALARVDGCGMHVCAPVQVASFFAGTASELDDGAVASLFDAPVVKLKIGRASESDDRALLLRALAALPNARFRIDGNRRLTLRECVARMRGLDAARFEYLEEPLRDPLQLPELSRVTGIDIALDESVADDSDHGAEIRESLAREECVVAWVLRMSALGALDAISAHAADAAHHGVEIVLSTAYESSFTLRIAQHLAGTLPNARRAHGIGTASLLQEDSCAPAIPMRGILEGAPLPVPFAEAWD